MHLFLFTLFAFPALISGLGQFCDEELPAIRAQLSALTPETVLYDLRNLPVVAPADRATYLAFLKSVYLWQPTDGQIQQIADAVTNAVGNFSAALSNQTYFDETIGCLQSGKSAVQTAYDLAVATMNTELDVARAAFAQAKADLEGNFTAFNNALGTQCNEIVAFEAYVLGVVSRFLQRVLDFATYIKVVTVRSEQATLAVFTAATNLLPDYTNTTLQAELTNAIKEYVEAGKEAERVVVLLALIQQDATAIQTRLSAALTALENRVHTFETRFAAFLAEYNGTGLTLTLAQQAAIAEYFRANAEFSFDLTSIRITVVGLPGNHGFTLSVTVNADGTATSTVKLAEFENTVRRWLLVQWGFHCKEASTTAPVVVKRVISDGQATDALSVTLYGSPSGASALFCSLLVLVFAFLFH